MSQSVSGERSLQMSPSSAQNPVKSCNYCHNHAKAHFTKGTRAKNTAKILQREHTLNEITDNNYANHCQILQEVFHLLTILLRNGPLVDASQLLFVCYHACVKQSKGPIFGAENPEQRLADQCNAMDRTAPPKYN